MVRTLSAGSTTQSARDHEIDAYRAHNAPRDACRERPRPRPPQDQAVFRGGGSDANRIDCDGPSRCSNACEPGACFSTGARARRVRGPDANRIDCDGPSRCYGACKPAARFGPGAHHARARAAAAHDRLARGEPRRVDDQDLSRVLEAGGSARRRRPLCCAGAPQIQTRRIAPEAAEAQSIRRPIRRRSRRQGARCRRSRHATLYRCRLNIALFMSNGRPRPSTSIRRLPPADPGHEPRGGPEFESPHLGSDRPGSRDLRCATDASVDGRNASSRVRHGGRPLMVVQIELEPFFSGKR